MSACTVCQKDSMEHSKKLWECTSRLQYASSVTSPAAPIVKNSGKCTKEQ